jgi:hypothetical protein
LRGNIISHQFILVPSARNCKALESCVLFVSLV